MHKSITFYFCCYFFYLSSFLKFTSKSKWSDNATTTTTNNNNNINGRRRQRSLNSTFPFSQYGFLSKYVYKTGATNKFTSFFLFWLVDTRPDIQNKNPYCCRVMSYILLSLFLLKNITKIRYIRIIDVVWCGSRLCIVYFVIVLLLCSVNIIHWRSICICAHNSNQLHPIQS